MKNMVGVVVITVLLISGAAVSVAVSRSSFEQPLVSTGSSCPCLHGTSPSEAPLETTDEYTGILPTIPPSWDWRDVGGHDWTTSIKDQDQEKCGSCWAFGALGAMESCIKIWTDNPTEDVDLSEQYMLSCSPGSCAGWYLDRTVKWIQTNGSIPEACFLYQADDTIPCDAKCQGWRQDLIGIEHYQKVAVNISVIQSALITYGPLPATMNVYEDFYPNFTGGVYHHTWGNLVFGHCIAIVGYNNTNATDGYWICKNSWGTGWGENGWFRIAYGECNIERGVYLLSSPNHALIKPDVPTGSIKGKFGTNYTYAAVANDPDNDTVKYCFDWGDNSSNWTGLVPSGQQVSMNHTWAARGTYNVKVKVKDEHGLESDWSDPLPVRMPLAAGFTHPFFAWLFQLFPHLASLLLFCESMG